MHPRERVLTVIARGKPDRCPIDFAAVPELSDRLREYFHVKTEDEICDALEADYRCVYPPFKNGIFRYNEDGTYYDHLGIHRKKVKYTYGVYEEFASAPLGFVEDLEDLKKYEYWPSVESLDWASFSDSIGNAHEKRAIRICPGGIFETACALRGFEQFLMDLIVDPELAEAIMAHLHKYCEEYIIRSMQYAGDQIDVVLIYDDLATQNSLFMSLDTMRKLILPFHKRLCDLVHSYGKKVVYHTCGAVKPVVEHLIETGIDVLNPLQPDAKDVDFPEFKRLFGDRVAFCGGISLQTTLPYGTPEDVRAAVRKAVAELGPSYIIAAAHTLQNDIPTDNILALYDPSIRYFDA